MLPALIASRQRAPRRILLAAAALVLATGAGLSAFGSDTRVDATPSLADALAPSTWAVAIPMAWIAASPAGLQAGDRVDILAMRSGDRAYSLPVAFGLRVMAAAADALVVEVDEEDAIALTTARSGGLLLVPILRSTR